MAPPAKRWAPPWSRVPDGATRLTNLEELDELDDLAGSVVMHRAEDEDRASIKGADGPPTLRNWSDDEGGDEADLSKSSSVNRLPVLRTGSVAVGMIFAWRSPGQPANGDASGKAGASAAAPQLTVKPAPWILRAIEGIHPRFHYGQFLLGLCSVGLFFAAAGSTYGVGYYTEFIMEELQLSRSVVSLAWTIALLATGCLLPLSGRLLDRFGPRRVMAFLPAPFALALVWLAHTSSAVTTTFAFFFMRWAMSTVMLTCFNACNQWWIRRKGVASAIINGIGALNITFPTMQAAIARTTGWRNSILVEAAIIAVVYTLIALLLLNRPEEYGRLPDGARTLAAGIPASAVKSQNVSTDPNLDGVAMADSEASSADGSALTADSMPREASVQPSSGDPTGLPPANAVGAEAASDSVERRPTPPSVKPSLAESELVENGRMLAMPGSLLDDVESTKTNEATGGPTSEVHWHWRDAVKTGAFWAVTLSSCLTSLLWSGLNFHYVSLLRDMGLDDGTISYIFLPIAVSAVVSMVFTGWLVDRIRVKSRIAALASTGGALSVALVFAARSPALALLFAVPYGFMDGAQTVGNTSVFAYMFGRVHLGRIDALVSALSTASLGLGPSLFGVVRDATGSYTAILVACGAPMLILTVVLMLTPAPKAPHNHRYLQLGDGR